MTLHSNTFSIQAATGNHSPIMTAGDDEQQSREATTSHIIPPPPGFATPISFVSKHSTSEDIGYSPRKKLRRTSLYADNEHLTPNSPNSDEELAVPNLRSPASILARLDLSHVPKNEFFLEVPSQVNSNSGIEYARPIVSRRTLFISKGDSNSNPSTDSLNRLLFNTSKHTGPTPSGLNRAMIMSSVFLPILDNDLEEDFSREGEVDFDGITTDTTSVYGFRLKPRARKLMGHPGDLQFTF
jgi:hypothetical protein